MTYSKTFMVEIQAPSLGEPQVVLCHVASSTQQLRRTPLKQARRPLEIERHEKIGRRQSWWSFLDVWPDSIHLSMCCIEQPYFCGINNHPFEVTSFTNDLGQPARTTHFDHGLRTVSTLFMTSHIHHSSLGSRKCVTGFNMAFARPCDHTA